MRQPRRSPKRRLVLTGVTVVGVAAVVSWVVSDAPARWLIVDDGAAPVDAAIVMAGDPDYERTRTAARLVLEGKARLLILTGGEPGPGDGSESLREVALSLGVPEARIRTETISHSTREALLAIRPILEREGVASATVVTSPYHLRRTLWAARKALSGLRLRCNPATPSFFDPRGFWRDPRRSKIVASEYCKLLYYVVRGWA